MPSTKKYQSDKKAAEDLANALQDLPDNWVMCRDMRHAWTVLDDFHVAVRQGSKIQEIRRTLLCLRCATSRREVYHQGTYGLDKVAQHYTYPDNYQIKGVPRGVKPQSIIQQEQWRRAMEKIASKAKGA